MQKNASPFQAYKCYFLCAYQPKRCVSAAGAVGGERGGVGQKHGLKVADFGLFYAGVRHKYPRDKCLFGVVVKPERVVIFLLFYVINEFRMIPKL